MRPIRRKPVQSQLRAATGEEEASFDGVIEQVFFTNDENGWTAVQVESPGHGSLKASGAMPSVKPGDHVRLTGRWEMHPRYGPQFKVSAYEIRVPTTEEGIRKYLGSGLVPGVGAGLAARLVDAFGEATLDVIAQAPERLAEVEGIGPKRARAIKGALTEQQGVQRVMAFLQGHGLSTGKAVQVYKKYGAESARLLEENPYRLADDIFGIGFLTADRIAAHLGVGRDSAARIEAGLHFTLSRAADEGHLYLPEDRLAADAAELLELDEGLVRQQLALLGSRRRLVAEEVEDGEERVRAVYRPGLYAAERELAGRLRRLVDTPLTDELGDVQQVLRDTGSRLEITLAPAQVRAVRRALGDKVMVITGGPGTGKTTIIRCVVEALERRGRVVRLAAPTGRAAKRMQEATGRPASTVHRLLEYSPRAGGFQRDAARPLEADLVIVDESSMLDVLLARALVRALPESARLVLVGDADQLPSVGPGAVLHECIQSGVVGVERLTEVFRQAARSQIVMGAHQVNRGEALAPPASHEAGELFVVETEDATRAAELVLKLVRERIPRRYGLDSVRDIQVLSPMRRGVTGVERLNLRLQEALNPGGDQLVRGELALRPRDKVMQIRNNYDKEVFNGDIGQVVQVDPASRRASVDFDGRVIPYERQELDELRLAYACTVHKSQGSEYPAVVLPLLHEHYLLLQRNLLYTAITRAKQLFVLVGSRRALGQAIANDRIRRRHTALAQRLRG